MWSPVPANPVSFIGYKPDQALTAALAGSQVALHEHRLAYENLLAAFTKDRGGWEQQKGSLEDQVRQLSIRNAEAERRMKEHLELLHTKLQGVEDAYAELDAEHATLRDHSGNIIEQLTERLEGMQQACEELEDERRSLQSQLSELQGESAVLEATRHRAAQLEAAIGALQQRAKELLAQLEDERATEAARAESLRQELGATREALAAQAAARAAHEDAALRLAMERQRLAAALQLERLINVPLRHTHYATTTTLSRVMRSPVAPRVQQQAAAPLGVNAAVDPKFYPPRVRDDLLAVPRPGSAPAAGRSTASAEFLLSRPDLTGTLTGRDLTRLARSWATTSPAAGPHPAYPDNLHSALSPPPPGPPRQASTSRSAAQPHPAYSPFFRPTSAASPSAAQPSRRPTSAAPSAAPSTTAPTSEQTGQQPVSSTPTKSCSPRTAPYAYTAGNPWEGQGMSPANDVGSRSKGLAMAPGTPGWGDVQAVQRAGGAGRSFAARLGAAASASATRAGTQVTWRGGQRAGESPTGLARPSGRAAAAAHAGSMRHSPRSGGGSTAWAGEGGKGALDVSWNDLGATLRYGLV